MTTIAPIPVRASVAQQYLRDVWVGWAQQTMVERVRRNPKNGKYARWIWTSPQSFIDGLCLDDILSAGACSHHEIERPTEAVISQLEAIADSAIKEHRLFPNASAHKAAHSVPNSARWELQAGTSLFRSKRCKTLAKLLRIRAAFQRSGFVSGTKHELPEAITNSPPTFIRETPAPAPQQEGGA